MSDAAIGFGEKVVALLDVGRVSSTYKYAALLAIIDVTVEHTDADGVPPESISAREVGRRVFELLWPQAVPFDSVAGQPTYLRHSSLRNDLVAKIAAVRREHGLVGGTSVDAARLLAKDVVDQIERDVTVTVIRMPLPKLQRYGHGGRALEDRFIYDYGWPDEVPVTEIKRPSFDDRLHFVGDAGLWLVRLAGLLRPFIEVKWSTYIADRNPQLVEDAALAEFLFGSNRIALDRVRGPLLDHQRRACFYCGDRIGGIADVDHFLPWSRHPDNALDNLVAAHPRCNNDKRAALAATTHLMHWLRRFEPPEFDALEEIAGMVPWPRRAARTLGSVRATYAWLPTGTKLWIAHGDYEMADSNRIRALLR